MIRFKTIILTAFSIAAIADKPSIQRFSIKRLARSNEYIVLNHWPRFHVYMAAGSSVLLFSFVYTGVILLVSRVFTSFTEIPFK